MIFLCDDCFVSISLVLVSLVMLRALTQRKYFDTIPSYIELLELSELDATRDGV